MITVVEAASRQHGVAASVVAPASIDDAVALAVFFVGGTPAAFVHPKRDTFVVMGRRLFATVEPMRKAEQLLYEIRLAKYGDGAKALERRLRADGYEELGHDDK